MNKKIIMALVFCILISMVIVHGAEIDLTKQKKGEKITISNENTYNYKNQKIAVGTGENQLPPGDYYVAQDGSIFPTNPTDEAKSDVPFVKNDGAVGTLGFVPAGFGQDTAPESTSAAGLSGATGTVSVPTSKGVQDIDASLINQYGFYCATGCTIRSTRSFSSENVNVRSQGGAVIVIDKEKGRTFVKKGDDMEEIMSTADDVIPVGAENIRLGLGKIAYRIGDEEHVLIENPAYGYEILDSNGNTQGLIIGNQRIDKVNGLYTYEGTTYTDFEPLSDGIKLSSGAQDFLEVRQTEQGTQTTRRSGDTEISTIERDDGTRVIETKEGGKIESKQYFNDKGILEAEDIVNEQGTEYTGERVFFDENQRPIGFCKQACEEPEISYNYENPDCDYDDPTCYGGLADGRIPAAYQDRVYEQQFLAGELDWQEAFRNIFRHSVNLNFLSEPFLNWIGLRDELDRLFSTAVFGEHFTSNICDVAWKVEPTSENIGVIRTPDGSYQAVAHIEGEKIAVSELRCNAESECAKGLECRENGLCYNSEGVPQSGYLYKVSWGVVAPTDQAHIVYGDATGGTEVNFNVHIRIGNEALWLFADEFGIANENSIILKQGEKSSTFFSPILVDYSHLEFTEACIVWGDKKPLDINGDPLDDICSGFVPSELVRTREGATAAEQASKTENVRFCGFNGC